MHGVQDTVLCPYHEGCFDGTEVQHSQMFPSHVANWHVEPILHVIVSCQASNLKPWLQESAVDTSRQMTSIRRIICRIRR